MASKGPRPAPLNGENTMSSDKPSAEKYAHLRNADPRKLDKLRREDVDGSWDQANARVSPAPLAPARDAPKGSAR